MDKMNHQAIHCVVGGQFGSEAKGHATAQIIDRMFEEGAVMIDNVRVGGPNAGHSAYHTGTGRVFALRQVPVGAVVSPDVNLIIAAGSEIDATVLWAEINELENAGIAVRHRLMIDSYATILEGEHIEFETNSDLNARTGSTSKGIGAARADRILRSARIARDCTDLFEDLTVCDTGQYLRSSLLPVVIEGTQGYGLGLHTRFYPQTTSGNCRSIDLCAQAGLTPTVARPIHTWLVVRTYPIRVAGNSGPLEGETTWEDLQNSNPAIPTERTTVTKKVRRVGQWDAELVREAIDANGGFGDHMSICLMFVDYVAPEARSLQHIEFFDAAQLAALAPFDLSLGQPARMLGTSERTVTWRY